jgi:hypothetical protein
MTAAAMAERAGELNYIAVLIGVIDYIGEQIKREGTTGL